ncbi:MAG: putative Zn finger-like uncharacterized protein [bacterium]|jgi:predicted Zn finger-like uncharacterized protein
MFIRCNHCQATYQIDDNQIPKRKAVVKCTKCSSSIPLPYSEEEESDEKLQPKPQMVEVMCSSCNSLYAIPLDKFKSSTIKVRCGKCRYLFVANIHQENNLSSSFDPANFPRREHSKALPDKVKLDDISIPTESEIQVDGLFDDLSDEDRKNKEKTSKENSPSKPIPISEFEDSVKHDEKEEELSKTTFKEKEVKKEEEGLHSTENEYLESVRLSEEQDDTDFGLGSIPLEQKNKFFLKKKNQQDDQNIRDNSKISDSVTKKESLLEKEEELLSSPLPISLEEKKEIASSFVIEEEEENSNTSDQEKDEIGNQEQKEVITPSLESVYEDESKKNRRLIITVAGIILLLLGAFFSWKYFLKNSFLGNPVKNKVLQTDSQNQLKILKNTIKKIKNNHYSDELYVIEGVIKNSFSNEAGVSWIRVQANLFRRRNQKIAKYSAYAGNILTKEQLKTLTKKEISQMLNFNNGQDRSNVNLKQNQNIKFQIVFFQKIERINRHEVKIENFYINKN